MNLTKEHLEFFAPLLGKGAGELSEAIKKDEDGNFDAEDAKRIILEAQKERFKQIEKDSRDEGYGRAKREVLTEKERELAEKFKIDGEVSSIEQVVEKAIENNKPDGQELTPEAIRESDVYQNDIKALKDAKESIESEFENFKNEYHSEKTDSKLNQYLKSLIDKEGFALPEDETRRKVLFDAFKKHLQEGKQFKIEGGQIQMLSSDGKPIKDDLHNVISIDDKALEVAQLFFDKKNDDSGKQSPGARQQPPASGGGAEGLPVINSQNDFYTKLKDVPQEKREAFKEQFKEFMKNQD